jgi:Zn-dependent M28 family amino/carboxypeptidase
VRFMKRLFVLPLFLLAACDGSSGPEATEPLSEDSLLVHLNFLADDSLYGRGSGSEYELEAAEYIRDAFDSYGLTQGVTGWFQSFTFDTGPTLAAPAELGEREQALPSQNVLGVIHGQGELSGQWVILGAHYDHVGFTQVTPDSIVIYNGADDNASGTSLMLEVARYLSHYFTQGVARSLDRRSVMFQAYGAEEAGLLGSSHFVNNPTVSMDSITAMVNLDMVGRLRANRLTTNGVYSSPLWATLLDERNEHVLEFVFPATLSGRSDYYPFFAAGKPVLGLYTGTHEQYHQPDDDVFLINTDGMVKLGDLVVAILLDLVTRPQPPTFLP